MKIARVFIIVFSLAFCFFSGFISGAFTEMIRNRESLSEAKSLFPKSEILVTTLPGNYHMMYSFWRDDMREQLLVDSDNKVIISMFNGIWYRMHHGIIDFRYSSDQIKEKYEHLFLQGRLAVLRKHPELIRRSEEAEVRKISPKT